MSSFPDILNRIELGEHLSRSDARSAIRYVCSGGAGEGQIPRLLKGLDYRRVTVDELAGAALAMREMVIAVPTGGAEVLDTCGTGGDVRHTFNISTAAALIAAACGVKVVKHGNRSASGRAGSADVLEKLGMNLTPPPSGLAECLHKANICFAFARALHPAMRHVAEARKSLGVPTIFNLLGPLTNPAHARLHLLGVFAGDFTERMAEVLRELGADRSWVVHAEDGLDEISTLSPTRISELKDGRIATWTLDTRTLGFPRARLDDIQIADATEAAQALVEVLDNQPGPRRDIAVVNAAAALVIGGKARDLTEGVAWAAAALESGAAKRTLESLIRLSQDH